MSGDDVTLTEAEREGLALLLRQAARKQLGLSEGDYWPSDVADAQAAAVARILADRLAQVTARAERAEADLREALVAAVTAQRDRDAARAQVERVRGLCANEQERSDDLDAEIKERNAGKPPDERREWHGLAFLTCRDVIAAIDDNKPVLDEYWRRDAHMRKLRTDRRAYEAARERSEAPESAGRAIPRVVGPDGAGSAGSEETR